MNENRIVALTLWIIALVLMLLADQQILWGLWWIAGVLTAVALAGAGIGIWLAIPKDTDRQG